MTKLGLLYYERIGVLLNHILEQFSVNLSVPLGNEQVVRGRQIILQSMSYLEISEERARAEVWWVRTAAVKASRHTVRPQAENTPNQIPGKVKCRRE